MLRLVADIRGQIFALGVWTIWWTIQLSHNLVNNWQTKLGNSTLKLLAHGSPCKGTSDVSWDSILNAISVVNAHTNYPGILTHIILLLLLSIAVLLLARIGQVYHKTGTWDSGIKQKFTIIIWLTRIAVAVVWVGAITILLINLNLSTPDGSTISASLLTQIKKLAGYGLAGGVLAGEMFVLYIVHFVERFTAHFVEMLEEAEATV